MKLVLLSAAIAATAIPAAPVLAHCRTVHQAAHRVAGHAPVRHRAVRYASACGCRTHIARAAYGRVAMRRAVYPIVYRRPEIVEVTYERPRPIYRSYGYAVPLYRPRPIFYGARFERGFHRHWGHEGWGNEGFYGRPHRWGGWR